MSPIQHVIKQTVKAQFKCPRYSESTCRSVSLWVSRIMRCYDTRFPQPLSSGKQLCLFLCFFTLQISHLLSKRCLSLKLYLLCTLITLLQPCRKVKRYTGTQSSLQIQNQTSVSVPFTFSDADTFKLKESQKIKIQTTTTRTRKDYVWGI